LTRSTSLAGRTVLVTGPARGIGAETARRLAREGANLALVGIEPDRLQALANELGPNAACFEADVRDMGQLEAAVEGATRRFDGIDVVIANAGIAAVGTTTVGDPEEFERALDVNLLGAWRTVRATLPHVVERGGYVLFVASLAAILPEGRHTAYAVSKAGVSALADSVRMEVTGSGVAVGCAFFGLVDTEMASWRGEGGATGGAGRRDRIPVSVAGQAVVDAVRRRSRWVVVPASYRPALYVPVAARRVAEWRLRARRMLRGVRRRG
jgi:NADP-dependent 3-hydroxy acid dehydrogenase YdfG